MRGRLVATAAVFTTLAVLPGAAHAATRLVSQGAGAAPPCTAAPCDLQSALNSADPGDAVSIASGTYTFAGSAAVADSDLDIVGEPGASKPVLRFNGTFPGTGVGFGVGVASGKLRNVAIEAPNGATAIGGNFNANITLSRVDVTASGACAQLLGSATIEDSTFQQAGAPPSSFGCLTLSTFGGNSTVRNVEVSSSSTPPPGAAAASFSGIGITIDRLVATGAATPGVGVAISGNAAAPGGQAVMRRSRISGFATGVSAGTNALVGDTVVSASSAAVQSGGGATLRNVTAVASGGGSRGLQILSTSLPAPFNTTSVKNSVLRGDAADVVIDPGTPVGFIPVGCTPVVDVFCVMVPPTSPGDPTIDHSNFRTVAGGTLNAAGGDNQSGDPKFADAGAGDFHALPGSPLIDAGVDDASNGPVDLDGKARKLGPAIDIGAFEADAVSPPPTGTGPSVTTPQQPVVADPVAPAITALGLTNKTFAVGSAATPVSAARAKKGTTFVYTLSEQATTTLTIERAETGRRKGRSCVKATKKNRKAKKCTRYAKVGALARNGLAGPNAVPFSGRIGNKALKPATYRGSLVATDTAGNKSKPKTIGFKVVRR
jgi:hypothetical protein